MEYKVVSAVGADELNELVNELIKQGWKPHGSIAMQQFDVQSGGHHSMAILFAQAMIKE
jgi:hypothetical protein